MVQSEQMPTTGEFEEMQVRACMCIRCIILCEYWSYYVYVSHFPQADLVFKKEEREKSEATAKTLELGVFVSIILRKCMCTIW